MLKIAGLISPHCQGISQERFDWISSITKQQLSNSGRLPVGLRIAAGLLGRRRQEGDGFREQFKPLKDWHFHMNSFHAWNWCGFCYTENSRYSVPYYKSDTSCFALIKKTVSFVLGTTGNNVLYLYPSRNNGRWILWDTAGLLSSNVRRWEKCYSWCKEHLNCIEIMQKQHCYFSRRKMSVCSFDILQVFYFFLFYYLLNSIITVRDAKSYSLNCVTMCLL